VSCVLLCLGARQYRLLAKGIAASLLRLSLPQPSFRNRRMLHSGLARRRLRQCLVQRTRRQRVLASRREYGARLRRYQREIVVRQRLRHQRYDSDMSKMAFAKSHIDSWVIREHGNSYLAITEW